MRFAMPLASAMLAMTAIPYAQLSAQVPAVNALTYADLADLAARAPVVADVKVARAQRLRGELAIDVPAGMTRFLVTGDVNSLIKGVAGLPGQISWLADLPNDAANRPPRIRPKERFLLLALPVPGRPGQVQLAGKQGQLPWDATLEQRLRGVIAEAAAPDAPPRVTGIGHSFYVPGAIPGESETQIFLTTDDGRPVSLSILRRPGEQPRWAVALAEMVDDSAAPPRRDTLLWYRLACFLPRDLPPAAVDDMDAQGVAAARADYRLVLDGLGSCVRTLPRP